MQQIYRRTPMPRCDFNKVAKNGFSPVNLYIFSEYLFLRTPPEGCLCSLLAKGMNAAETQNYMLSYFGNTEIVSKVSLFHLGCSSTKIWWRPGNHSRGIKASIWAGEIKFSEAYSEPSQTSKMELFAKIVNGF